jgi:hypothetical protein
MRLIKQIAILSALLCLAVGVSILCVVAGLAIYFELTSDNFQGDLSDVIKVALLFAVFALPIALGLGASAFFFLRETRLLNGWSVCLLGTSIGAAIGMSNVVAGVPWVACVALGFLSSIISWFLITHSNLPLTASDATPSP